jgi:hypothetical protein
MDWRPLPKLPRSYWKLRRVAQAIIVILLLSVSVSVYFQDTYIYYPSQPSPEEGKVVGVLIKGRPHYITHRQWMYTRWALYTTVTSGALLAAVFALIYLRYGKDGFRRDIGR